MNRRFGDMFAKFYIGCGIEIAEGAFLLGVVSKILINIGLPFFGLSVSGSSVYPPLFSFLSIVVLYLLVSNYFSLDLVGVSGVVMDLLLFTLGILDEDI